MKIELPPDIVERVQLRARLDKLESEAEVIRKALDVLDWQDQEQQAIQEGINAWHAGDIQDFEEFDAEFRSRNGIKQADAFVTRIITGPANGVSMETASGTGRFGVG